MTSSTDRPDQGDPAAWGVISPGDDVVTVPHPIDGSNVTGSREWAQACVDRNGGTVVPLYRAPGDVAAAPPGDEDPFDSPPSAWDGTYDPLTGAPTVPDDDAPPAGHEDEAAVQLPALGQLGGTREDEAAVERAARALYAHANHGFSSQWDEPGTLAALARDAYRDRARAALAAARGPRTPDPGAGQ